MSIYGISRLGSCISVLDSISIGSVLSVRSFTRLGSSLSLYGYLRCGSSRVKELEKSCCLDIEAQCPTLGQKSAVGT